jgi:hypothetical protein
MRAAGKREMCVELKKLCERAEKLWLSDYKVKIIKLNYSSHSSQQQLQQWQTRNLGFLQMFIY